MELRIIQQNEIQSALSMVWEVFFEFEAPDYSAEGIKTFKNFIDDKNEIAKLDIYGAYDNNQIVGTIAIRNGSHISLLFVKKKYHRQGIAKSLFGIVLPLLQTEVITVNSSPYAVEIYHRLGFTDTEPEKTVNGIRFTPMCYIK